MQGFCRDRAGWRLPPPLVLASPLVFAMLQLGLGIRPVRGIKLAQLAE